MLKKILTKENERRIFTPSQITAGGFIGGPLAAGMMISGNYEAAGESELSERALKIGIGVLLLLSSVIYFVPALFFSYFPPYLIPFIYGTAVILILRYRHKKEIAQYLENGLEVQTGIRPFLIISANAFFIVILFFTVLSLKPLYEGNVERFGTSGNEIYYDNTISEKDIDSIALFLTQINFFNDKETKIIEIRESASGVYTVFLPVREKFWEEELLAEVIQKMKEGLEGVLPGKSFDFIFVDETLRGRKTRKFNSKYENTG